MTPSNRPYGTLDYFPVPDQIFASLCMDFLSLPKVTSETGAVYDTVFVIVDRLSGYIQGIPCLKAGLDAEDCARLFLQNCVCLMGVPLDILSDNDKLITSKFFMTLCESLGIEQHSAVIYRPKGNGRAERAVKSVINILRLTLTGIKDSLKWADVLPWACFLQNSMPGVVSDYSPHRIVFGRELVLPGELPKQDPTVQSVSGKDWFDKVERSRKLVRDRLVAVHDRERTLYLKSHTDKSMYLVTRYG